MVFDIFIMLCYNNQNQYIGEKNETNIMECKWLKSHME